MSNDNEKVFFKPYFLVALVMFGFIAFIGSLIVSTHKEAQKVAPATAEPTGQAGDQVSSEVEEITAPVGQVAVADGSSSEGGATSGNGDLGKTTYESVCFACHGQGIAGAPKFGDKEAWGPRIEKGLETLHEHALKGFTGSSGSMMPAKGGRADLSDEAVMAAVDYMVSAAGGKVSEVSNTSSQDSPESSGGATVAVVDGGKGKEVYEGTCFACHATGVAGAPKFGDKEAWAPRISKGKETLYDHALHGFMGKGMMPPKGGKADLSDEEVKAAVDYMVNKSS